VGTPHPVIDSRLEHYRGALFALALDRLGNIEDAHDLAQEALVRACEQWAGVRDPASPLPWLRAVVANLCRDHWRRGREQCVAVPPNLADEGEDVCGAAIQRELLRQVRAALRDLPEANRVALTMSVAGEYTCAEIALFLGVRESTVVGRIHRARVRLRRALSTWLDGTLDGKEAANDA
jgi:RNA polymerase sigma-70 factor, ECF subfamily